MAKWIREEVSGVLKLAVYVNLDKEPKIAKWINDIPHGKTGEHIREAIRFYLEQANLQSTSEKIKKRSNKKGHKKKGLERSALN